MSPDAAPQAPPDPPVVIPQGTRHNVGTLLIGYGGRLVEPDRAMLSVLPPGTGPRAEQFTLEVGQERESGGYVVRLEGVDEVDGTDVAKVTARVVRP